MTNLTTLFKQAFEKIRTTKFLNKEGLGGEIPFFIFPYKIKWESEINGEITGLKKRLKREGIEVLELNLYDITIDILEKKGGIEKMFSLEERQKHRPGYFMKALQSALNIQEVFIPYIREQIANIPHDLIFITGVAPVYPYIRSHVILNNLHSITDRVPTIMFYPGEYTGNTLRLFEALDSDNYYRAYNLNHYQL
ncbi:MAG: DUF1788 domain-containing protein [Bacteroidales bacterium]|jgi:hypothetical protein|nr:DUF1788 domain-containing protein [Bacteroidales bacterium]